uniref:Uncharacterized protein n=1 Tax=Anguilla anguilla TaxID=7936 RepID=A0A0E9UI44_ANGAN
MRISCARWCIVQQYFNDDLRSLY